MSEVWTWSRGLCGSQQEVFVGGCHHTLVSVVDEEENNTERKIESERGVKYA